MMNRHPIIVFVLILAFLSGATWVGYLTLHPRAHSTEVAVFRPPSSFCETVKLQSFTAGIDGVIEAGPNLRPRMMQLRASLLTQTARLDDTPRQLVRPLVGLADDVKVGTDASLAIAKVNAGPIDIEAQRACPLD